ncbi:hypothetical protein [uncultured Methanolobus sp.]|uniref:hypothetical protein n=1 Tax=uncultured Methanolobus sp. TaxID=218300 RepID=UPI002AAB3F78|nr:hypothetical protein [uncultured Methanolobus sp.]
MDNENYHENRSKTDSPKKIIDKDDADYKPILKNIINTRCNYDGSKIEGIYE